MKQGENERIRRLLTLDKKTITADGRPYNRLIFASSPYLLQHAENPVDWFEWGSEAFEKAAREDKPVLLSIGYASCHWCHVMAHESFEDRQVAEVINRNFVPIKVDREERPDIDSRYMLVAQMMTGGGGWPLNVFMTPECRPFYAATYIPRIARGGMPGIIPLLEKLAELWQTERNALEQSAASMVEALARQATTREAPLSGDAVLADAFAELRAMYDKRYGGFGEEPKFPMPVYLSFLFHKDALSVDKEATGMAEDTLNRMRRGGIYDQIGFGFHRYSVDRGWLVPHFEKMLYDQALLAVTYIQGWQANGDERMLRVAEEILFYVMKDMAGPDGGGFCAGQDADSEGEEGRYYLWRPSQVIDVTGRELGELWCRVFDITERGNFEGRSIPHLAVPIEEAAAAEKIEFLELERLLEDGRTKLLEARSKRVAPLRDEKIVTGWNGLMVSALAKAYGATGKANYLDAASNTVNFIEHRLRSSVGRLMRSRLNGEPTVPAFLEDYAFHLQGVIDLYSVTLDDALIEKAATLAQEMIRLFKDDVEGGMFDSGSDTQSVLVRLKNPYDGVIPSGNSVAALSLLRLGRILDDDRLTREGERTIRAFMGNVEHQPLAYMEMLLAYSFFLGQEVEVEIPKLYVAGGNGSRFFQALYRRPLPNLVIRPGSGGSKKFQLCARGACQLPVATVTELEQQLDQLR